MQTGFNHNIKHKGKVFHVQTEDSGLKTPHIITHLFVGGNIVATKKTSYADVVASKNVDEVVRRLMEEQHKQMLRNLIHGAYDQAVSESLGERFPPPGMESATLPPGVEAEPTQIHSVPEPLQVTPRLDTSTLPKPPSTTEPALAQAPASMIPLKGETTPQREQSRTEPMLPKSANSEFEVERIDTQPDIELPADLFVVPAAAIHTATTQPLVPKAVASTEAVVRRDSKPGMMPHPTTVSSTTQPDNAHVVAVAQRSRKTPEPVNLATEEPKSIWDLAFPQGTNVKQVRANVTTHKVADTVEIEVPPEVAAARSLPEKPLEKPAPRDTIFGEDLMSDKSLDEVILSYLADDLESDI